MSDKKHKRFYMIVSPSGTQYVKLESEWIFGAEEGVETLKESHPNATEIKYLNKKAASFLGLFK